MPTIAAYGFVVVAGFVVLAVLAVIVLAFMASRLEQAYDVDLDATRLRFKVSIQNQPDVGAKQGQTAQAPTNDTPED
jgi:hypothetical protein